MTADVIDLDRRLSRALECGRGIRLSDSDLDLLAEGGAIDIVRQLAATELKERAKCRDVQRRRACITVVDTGSTGTSELMEAFGPLTSLSSGMTPEQSAFEAFQQARLMSKRGASSSSSTTSRKAGSASSAQRAGKR